jgi:molecular chaperone HscB
LKNHFELFGLAPAFALDRKRLEQSYREIQAKVHPDRFARAGDSERRASMQMTTQVNEAYRTLDSPVQRARYLLELNGVDAAFETDTAMPTDFLMDQIALREALEAAHSAAALDAMQADLTIRKRRLESEIADCIDARRDHRGAFGAVRKLMFLEKLGEEIGAAYDRLGA